MWSDAGDRYKTPVALIFSAENKLQIQLKIESTLAKVQAKLGLISNHDFELIEKAAESVTLKRVKEIDSEIHHDLMAVVKAMSEKAGKASKKVHLGATSNDIQDTTLALQLVETKNIILDELDNISEIIYNLAQKHKNLACIGRTHGQHAVATTVGFKFSNFLFELFLAKRELLNTPVHLSKFSGAIGNYASTGRMDIESGLLDELNLQPVSISTQVITRVIHSSFLHAIALNASVLERISKEIRNLQRTEIKEWLEPFSRKQVGSSAMPHKRNPHKSERVSGIARIIRNNVSVGLENISLEHERDLSHSSVERIIIPESCNLLFYIAQQMNEILSGLEINKVAIRRNLESASGSSKSELILEKLVDGLGRQEGHELLRKHVNAQDFKKSVLNDSEILKYIAKTELESIFNLENVGLSVEKTQKIMYEHLKNWKFYRD